MSRIEFYRVILRDMLSRNYKKQKKNFTKIITIPTFRMSLKSPDCVLKIYDTKNNYILWDYYNFSFLLFATYTMNRFYDAKQKNLKNSCSFCFARYWFFIIETFGATYMYSGFIYLVDVVFPKLIKCVWIVRTILQLLGMLF